MRDGSHGSRAEFPHLVVAGRWSRWVLRTISYRERSASGKSLIGRQGHEGGIKFSGRGTHLSFRALSSLHTIATLDHIGLQAYRSRSTVQLQKQAAGVAKDRTVFVPAPQGRGGSATVLADGL